MRVWIGCLACYNEGRLVGEWWDVEGEIPQSHGDWFALSSEACSDASHEELWVFDVDDAPHSSLSREMSPAEAAEIGERLRDLERQSIEPGAYFAYGDNVGYDATEDYVGEFEEAYQGEYADRVDFASRLADDLGLVPDEQPWPLSYIDWDRAARDLFMDYFDVESPGGIYVFRNV